MKIKELKELSADELKHREAELVDPPRPRVRHRDSAIEPI